MHICTSELRTEYQSAGLMNTLDKELVDSLIDIASKCNPIMILDDRNMLKIQREEKSRRQALAKKNKLEKAEKSYIESLLWYDR